MYKFKKELNKEDYNNLDELKLDYRYINIYKRSMLFSPALYRDFNRELIDDIETKEFEVKEKVYKQTLHIKKIIFDKIFSNKKNKYKIDFIKYNCILTDDLMSLLYDFTFESKYIIAIKIYEEDQLNININLNKSFFLSSNMPLIKNIFFNNKIEKMYKINTDKINNRFLNIEFFESYSQLLYHYHDEKFYDISTLKNNNDFYAPIICIGIFYFKRNNIKIKKIYISNYDNMYLVRNFSKNKKLVKFELYYLNKITTFENYKNLIPISRKDIFKYHFLREIYDYITDIFKSNIEKQQKL